MAGTSGGAELPTGAGLGGRGGEDLHAADEEDFPPCSKQAEGILKQRFHTAILRKQDLGTFRDTKELGNRLNFLAVEHPADDASHVHVVWCGDASVRLRGLNAILAATSLGDDQKTIARGSCQTIRSIRRFLLYLIRRNTRWLLNGLRFNGLRGLLGAIQEDAEAWDGSCRVQDILREDREDLRRTTSSNVNALRLAYLETLIAKFPNAHDLNDLKRQLTSQDVDELYKHFGPWSDKHLRFVWDKHEVARNNAISRQAFSAWLKSQPCKVPEHEAKQSRLFFDRWFEAQNISPIDFFASVILIGDKLLHKYNALLLRGCSNSGKSLLMRLIVQGYPIALIGRSGETSSFYLQPLLKKTAALFEEARITPATIDDFKLVFGGEDLDINVKGAPHEKLSRRPCFLTCNHSLTTMCSGDDVAALQNRIISFVCRKPLYATTRFRLTQAHLLDWLNSKEASWKAIDARVNTLLDDNSLLSSEPI